MGSPSQFLGLGFPFDTSLSAVRLIQSGLFDETPDLRLIVAHVGGVIPYLWGRLETFNAASSTIHDSPRLRHPIGYYLSKLYVDTVSYRVEALQCCYEVMGGEHLLYGTDHPFGCPDVAGTYRANELPGIGS
jgi:predicted TIM-barrel fold metal-dependent hydrolase